MSKSRSARRVTSLAAMLVLLVGFAACAGGSDDDDAGGGGGGPGSEGSGGGSDEELDTIQFIDASPSFAFMASQVAVADGCFEEAEVDVEHSVVLGTGPAANAVLAGDGDIGTVTMVESINLASAGRGLVTIANPSSQIISILTLSNEAVEASGVAPDDPIEDRLAALPGLTIGVLALGVTPNSDLVAALEEQGLSGDDVNFQVLADSTAMVGALREGRIDGFVFSPPDGLVPSIEGFGEVWIDFGSGELEATDGRRSIAVVTTEDYLAENQEAVRRFLEGMWCAGERIEASAPETLDAVSEMFFPQLDRELFDAAFEASTPSFLNGLIPSEEDFEDALEQYNLQQGETGEPADVTFDDVYDLTLTEETQP